MPADDAQGTNPDTSLSTQNDGSAEFLASIGLGPGPDALLAGKYRIERLLGRGGVGVVFQATHTRLNQRVAIKLLLSTAMPDAIARFTREAQAAARLKNEHIARVLDVGELPSGMPFMVMEYLEGCDLDEHLRAQGALPVREAADYVLQACEALAEAHAAGIVHRDLKPANLFLTKRADGGNTIKLLDFGISKDQSPDQAGGTGMKLTQTTAVFGSPLYMSPEQMRAARNADVRSDIWAIGVILYELCTGKPPFDAEVYSDLVLKVSLEAPPPPASIRRDLPPKLEAVILRCLEKDPARRFPDVAKLAEALVPFASKEASFSAVRAQDTLKSASQPALAQSGSKNSQAVPARDAFDRTSKPESKSAIMIGAALSGALVAGGLLWLLASSLSNGDNTTPSIEASPQAQNSAAASAGPEAAHPEPVRVEPAGAASLKPPPEPAISAPASPAPPPSSPAPTPKTPAKTAETSAAPPSKTAAPPAPKEPAPQSSQPKDPFGTLNSKMQ